MDRNYYNAVIALRKLVEEDGVELDEALRQISTERRPGLGLNQAAQLEREARKRYG